MTWKNPFRSKNREFASPNAASRVLSNELPKRSNRKSTFEVMEQRCMFDAAPIWVGGVYIESDIGSDFHGDDFYVSFTGGAANTQLSKIIINTDQDVTGISRGDNLFDTVDGSLGADHSFGFKVERIVSRDPKAKVTASVSDGGMQLILTFENFYAGDLLVFSIDVDEVQIYDTTGPLDLGTINDGIDPITSGVEFQGSKFDAFFKAPNYEDIQGNSTFTNRYDSVLAPSGLTLPADDNNGLRDRSAGTAFTVTQIPKPISIAGTVYVDNNVNLVRDPGEQLLEGVTLELYRKEGSQYITTGFKTTTNAQGNYEFGINLQLKPGTYEVRETQPNGYYSVGATPGVLNGTTPTGLIVSGNKDILTEIVIPLGDQRVTRLDFAEAQPARIAGFVYVDANDDGIRDANESGIAGVDVQIIGINTVVPFTAQTIKTKGDGSYEFSNLPPGTYRVVELTQPVDFFDGKDTPGRVGGSTRGQFVLNDQLTEILLNGNDVGTEYNFGELPPSSLSGHVCMSLPGFDCFSSLPNSKEPLVGVKIELLNASGVVIATTTTGIDGTYRFDKLPAGIYSIVETTPDNVIDGGAKAGTIGGQSIGQVLGSSRIGNVSVGPGQDGINYDFCELMPATLSGHVFEDVNDDGVRQNTEPLIAGVLVSLFDLTGNKLGETQTNALGAYSFVFLRPGTYRIVESQPSGYVDGRDQIGTILGSQVGVVDSATDTFSQVTLPAGRDGINYDFGELKMGSIRGTVFVDPNKDGIIQPEETRLPGVRIDLIDKNGVILRTTFTKDDGTYFFDGLTPGEYTVRETQPSNYFDGKDYLGSGGGELTNDNLAKIPLRSGQALVEYNFTELPPGTISGFVFQDGETLVTADGKPPIAIRPFRDGIKTADDTPIPEVTLELRLLNGQRIDSKVALPGVYSSGFIRVKTDANGYFEFTGLPDGVYHVYQVQPEGYVDGLDTPGSSGGVAVNAEDEEADFSIQVLMDNLRQNAETDPQNNAILRIDLVAGRSSINNNFSEILLATEPLPPKPPTPVPPINPPPPPFQPPPVNGNPTPPFDRMLSPVPPGPDVSPLPLAGGVNAQYSWHLSVINAGMPRGAIAGKTLSRQRLAQSTAVLDANTWTIDEADPSQWTYVSVEMSKIHAMRRQAFDVEGAIPLAGDFNGDGQDEIALFLEGEWLIDINGNGRWDKGDMWAKLGSEEDLPVVGDWDGDGKDDIGIFGPEWVGDERALENEPGIPDPENRLFAKPKNLPPDNFMADVNIDTESAAVEDGALVFDATTESSTEEERLLQRSILGPGRSDVIDHVFRFGIKEDQPVAGDFNGAGISTIGIFSGGKWRLDVNGDGRFTQDIDKSFDFGQPGDLAVVGDFDGDGIDEVAVIRGNQMIVDANRNQQMDVTDRVFELEGEGDQAVVGDFDGDGKDEAALIKRTAPNEHGINIITREARKAS